LRNLGRTIDRRTTIVILGDGRTNYQPPEIEVLTRLRGRARGGMSSSIGGIRIF
jgi:uncharacterized protein with von Willebrand factor type A (vWA) domain